MSGAGLSAVQAAPPRWQCWWLAARPRTLTASLVPIVVGLAITPPRLLSDFGIALATILSALFIQVGVNFANDCFDAEAGIDTAERLGPVRAVQAGLVSARDMKRAFAIVLALAMLFGIPLIVRGGAPILATGIAALICAWAYAGGPKPLASLGLGDLFVFVFFGVVPVAGTVWLQVVDRGPPVEGLLAAAFFFSLPVGLLAVAILVVNNLRDIATDRAAAKLTTAVRFGEAATRRAYEWLVVLAIVVPLLAAPVVPGVLLTLLSAPLAVRTVRGLRSRTGSALNASLGETARFQLVHGLLLAAGIAASRLSL
jgi:1,4-dihydroxy-2-naphthoate polyprenyltransferase